MTKEPAVTKEMTTEQWTAAREGYIGWCTECGSERDSCEPDAQEYECEACGEMAVHGAEEWLNNGWIEILE